MTDGNSKMKRGEKATLISVLFLALILRVYRLEFHSLWIDELVTWFECWGKDFAEFWANYSRLELTPPLYFFTEFAIARFFPATDVALRIASVVFGFCFVCATALFAHELSEKKKYAAAIGALFAATCYRAIAFSQEARCYSLLLFLAALSGWAWVRLRPSVTGELKNSRWRLYLLAAVALMYTHYFGVLMVTAQFITISLLKPWKTPKYWLKLYGLIGLCYTPWLYFLVTHPLPGGSNVKAPPPFSEVFVAHRELFGSSAVNSLLALILAAIAIYAANASLERRKRLAVLLWVFVVFFLSLAISYVKPIYSIRYYILALAPSLAIAAVGAIEIARWRKSTSLLIAVLFAALGLHETVVGRKYYSTSTEQQVREVSEASVKLMRENPDAAVVLIAFPGFLYPYYFTQFGAPEKVAAEFATVADFLRLSSWPQELQAKKKVIALTYTYSDTDIGLAYEQIAASAEFSQPSGRSDFHEASVAVFTRRP